MSELRIGADAFHVVVAGDPAAPPLVLCHALGADLTMWDPQMAAFTQRFRVVRYDARGHGGGPGSSDLTGAPVSVARLGRDALAILDALAIAQAHWIGASMGGAVVQWLLVNAPARVGRAVLATTASRLGTPDLWNGRIGTALARGMAPITEATMERWFGADFARRSPETMAKVRETMLRTSPQGYAACCAALRDMDLRRGLGRIAAPVLVVTGTRDAAVPPAATAALLDAIDGARHVAFATRHMPNIEAADAFTEATIAFLTAADEPPVRAAREAGVPRRAASVRPASTRTTKAVRTVPRTKVAPPPLTSKALAARRAPTTNAARGPARGVVTEKTAAKASGGPTTGADETTASANGPAKDGAAKKRPTKRSPAKRGAPEPAEGADAPQSPMPPPRRKPGGPRGRGKP